MKDIRVARRYAAALFGVAQRDGAIDAITQDLVLVSRFIAEVPYLRAVLLQPLVTETRKNKVLDEAFGSRVSPTSLNFLRLLIRKRREDLIDEVMREFRSLVAAQQNRVDAIATTANPLSPGQEERLTQSLQSMTGKTVRLTTNVDPAIVGGVVVRIGDSVIDGSVRGQLQRLEQQLLGQF